MKTSNTKNVMLNSFQYPHLTQTLDKKDEILNQVQDDNMMRMTRGFTPLVTPQALCAGYRGGPHTISRTTTLQDDVVCGPRGFTLIELLVVVLIIGILAAVALPQYNKVIKKAHGTEALVALESLDKALTSYYLENGTYEGVNLETLDLTIPELHHFKYEVGSAGEGSSPDNTSFKTQSGYDKSIGLFLHSPDHKVTIGTWWDKGSTTGIYCSVTSTSDISCGDYFNCGATPRLYHPETSQSGSTFPAYYSGGDCRIK